MLWIEPHRTPQAHLMLVRSSGSVPTAREGGAGPMLDVERAWAKGLHGEGQAIAVGDSGFEW